MSEIRLGIAGTGRIAKRAVREISFTEGLSVCAVYNPNREHAREFVEENLKGDADSLQDGAFERAFR